MDVNAMGLPTSRPVQTQSSTPQPSAVVTPVADNYAGDTGAEAKVNTGKAALPEGVGANVDKAA